MPPLNASQLEAWSRRLSRSLEDLEPLYAADGKYALRQVRVRQARVRKAARARAATTPPLTAPRKSVDRITYANDKTLLLQALASDCGCVLHPKGCYHALFEHYGMGLLDDIIHWRSRNTGNQHDVKQALQAVIGALKNAEEEFVPKFPPVQAGMEICATTFHLLTMIPSSNLNRELKAESAKYLQAAINR